MTRLASALIPRNARMWRSMCFSMMGTMLWRRGTPSGQYGSAGTSDQEDDGKEEDQGELGKNLRLERTTPSEGPNGDLAQLLEGVHDECDSSELCSWFMMACARSRMASWKRGKRGRNAEDRRRSARPARRRSPRRI